MDIDSFESLALPTLDLQQTSTSAGKVGGDGGVACGGEADGKDKRVVLVMDEIGKMELFSRGFVERVRSLFEATSHTSSSSASSNGRGLGNVTLLATVPVQRPQQKPHPLLAEIRQRKDCKLYEASGLSVLMTISSVLGVYFCR